MSQKFYPGSARNWSTLDTVQLQFGSATATFTGNRSIHTPAEYSYHCQSVNSFQDPLLVMVNSTGNASNWRLNFVDLQVQLHAFWMYPSVFVCHYWIVITDIVFFPFGFVLRYRFRALAWTIQEVSPTPVTAQASSPLGFGWGCWLHWFSCWFSCTACRWSWI